jgi:hypothetical protein
MKELNTKGNVEPIILVKDFLRHEVEKRTDGAATVLYDEREIPSYMLRVSQFNVETVDSTLGKGIHPAFIVGDREVNEIFVGLRPATLIGGLAYSLPGKERTCSINFDTARESCTKKGKGWHLLNNWEWAALIMFLAKNSFAHFEKSWWEWTDGLKLVDGKFFFPHTNNFEQPEAEWEYQNTAIDDIDGLPVLSADVTRPTENDRNTNGDYTHISEIAELKKADSYNSLPVDVRERFARLLIDSVASPIFSTIKDNDFYVRNYGERMPIRGGYWDYGAGAGLAALNLDYARSDVDNSLGCRPAFIGI